MRCTEKIRRTVSMKPEKRKSRITALTVRFRETVTERMREMEISRNRMVSRMRSSRGTTESKVERIRKIQTGIIRRQRRPAIQRWRKRR